MLFKPLYPKALWISPWFSICQILKNGFFFLLNNIFYEYSSLWQCHKLAICRCDGRMVRGRASSFLLILVYFFRKHCIRSFGPFKCFVHFFFIFFFVFNMLRTKIDNYIFSYLCWSWSGKNIMFFSWSQGK